MYMHAHVLMQSDNVNIFQVIISKVILVLTLYKLIQMAALIKIVNINVNTISPQIFKIQISITT